MAIELINLLRTEECTVHTLRTFMDKQPNIQSIINKQIHHDIPLHVAIERRQSVDIIEELLKHGAEVNHSFLSRSPILVMLQSKVDDCCETRYYDGIRILLKHGANINIQSDIHSPFLEFVNSIYNLRTIFFIPTLHVLLPYADNYTKAKALDNLISSVIRRCSEEEIAPLENSYQAVNLVLESGGGITRYLFIDRYFKMALKQSLKIGWEKNSHYVINLFKLTLPYCAIDSLAAEVSVIEYNFISLFIALKNNRPYNILRAEIMSDLLINLWGNCVEERHKMEQDILTNNKSLLHVLKSLDMNDSSYVTSYTVYGVMLRIAYDKYPHCKDYLRRIIKKTDMRQLYPFIYKGHIGNNYAINYDCFNYISNYLSKDEIFNYLLALLPAKN